MNMKRSIFVFVGLAAALLCLGHAQAAEAYLKATGIPGDSKRELWRDYVEVQAYTHEVISPRDPASGLPTGKRQHMPFKIVKRVNNSSPVLMDKLVKNSTISSVELNLVATDPNGEEYVSYVYKLENVKVVGIRNWAPNNYEPSVSSYPAFEEVTFTYQTITWESKDGKTVATDTVSPER